MSNQLTSCIGRWCLGQLEGSPREWLKRDVETLFERYLAKRPFPPVNVEMLAELCDCKVEYSHLGRGASGLLVPIKGGFVLKVNPWPETRSKRQRFTVAHEIAHTFFYRRCPDGRAEKIVGRLSHYEEEALCNFAAQRMLIPRELIHGDLFTSTQQPDLDLIIRLSKIFQVSSEVAARRVKEEGSAFGRLGLCEWVTEDIYLRSRRLKPAVRNDFRPLVLQWMVPPNEITAVPMPRGARVQVRSPIWEFWSGQRESVTNAEIQLGKKLIGRLGNAVIRKTADKPSGVLATILELRDRPPARNRISK